jgi:hypothetical protein
VAVVVSFINRVNHGDVEGLGHTTGSHLGLPDEQERELTLLWVATVTGGRVSGWRLLEDTPDLRRDLGLDQV